MTGGKGKAKSGARTPSPPPSGNTRQTIFFHLIRVLLAQPDDSPLEQALSQTNRTTPADILSMLHKDINALEYQEGKNLRDVPNYQANYIHILQQYHRFRDGCRDPVVDWLQVTRADIDEYRIGPHFNDFAIIPEANHTRMSIASQSPAHHAVQSFRKGIKRDPTQFPTLSKDTQWDAYHRELLSTARAQGVELVCDPKFVPRTGPDDQELFAEHQKYMYAVFVKTLKTDYGKTVVRSYEKTFDAQSVHRDITEHYTQSTAAQMDSSDILSYLTTAKWGDTRWNGTAHSFLLHWLEQARLYDDTADSALADTVKYTLLQNAVRPLPELRAVSTTVASLEVNTNRKLSFEEYKQLLLSAAQTYDGGAKQATRTDRSRTSAARRRVYQHDSLPTLNDD